MKFNVFVRIALAFGLIAGLVGSAGLVQASARTASWVVSVTYQNVGTASTPVSVNFYPEGSASAIAFDPLSGGQLAQGAGASFFIGSVSGLAQGFRGSAVMSSAQPLVATVVQFSQDAGFRMRMLSNGFRSEDASSQYLIATVLMNKFQRTTVFSIQNAEPTEAVTAVINFYNADNNGALASTKSFSIPAGSSKYVEMDNAADTGLAGSVFNGSAIVTATKTGGAPALVVAAANELYTNKDVGANFEGLPLSRASNELFMATALCNRFGLDTFYAVQNASLTAPSSITVTYYNPDGSTKTTDGPYALGAGQKKSITTCAPSTGVNMTSFTGSAKITSTGAPIVAIGKAQGSVGASAATANVFTAFMGEPVGASKLALPFVRYANDANFNSASNLGGKQRAFIAVQNVGAAPAVINVKYYDKAGQLVGTQQLSLNSLAKGNSDASGAGALGKNGMVVGEFGYYTDNTFGGAVTIEADAANPTAKFIAIVRAQHPGAGEDYNGVAVQ